MVFRFCVDIFKICLPWIVLNLLLEICQSFKKVYRSIWYVISEVKDGDISTDCLRGRPACANQQRRRRSRNFVSTLVPGSGSFQLTNLMGYS